MVTPTVKYTTTPDGVNIAWGEAGQGPDLVFCAAAPFTHVQEIFAINEAFWGRLAGSFRVILFDGRGVGLSDRDVADVSIATLMTDTKSVIDAARADRFVVVSDVSLLMLCVSLQLAIELPERITHIALDSPWQNMRELADTPYGRTGLALAEADWTVYVETVMRILMGWDSVASDWVDPLARAVSGWAEKSVGLQYIKEAEKIDVGELLTQITQPTLVLRNDPNAIPARCSQRIAARIPGAQFRQYCDPTYAKMADLIAEFVGAQPTTVEADSPPSTLRTVLFTDLVGHTEMMRRLGDDRGREVLREHERITRALLKQHGGAEVKTMGDGFMASFGSVTKAVECAIALQRAFAEHDGEPLSVRVGLNAGEPIEEDGDLFGATVILASRIAARADAGEILVADTVRGLCSGKGFLFSDRGEFVAKGFEDPVRVYEVKWRE